MGTTGGAKKCEEDADHTPLRDTVGGGVRRAIQQGCRKGSTVRTQLTAVIQPDTPVALQQPGGSASWTEGNRFQRRVYTGEYG